MAHARLAKGNQGTLESPLRCCPRDVADGRPQRIGDKGMQHMPGDEVWLVGERRASGEQKYYLANLPAHAGLETLAATIKARWVCEQAHQQLKDPGSADNCARHCAASRASQGSVAVGEGGVDRAEIARAESPMMMRRMKSSSFERKGNAGSKEWFRCWSLLAWRLMDACGPCCCGLSGAPSGERNGNYRSGLYAREAIAERRAIRRPAQLAELSRFPQ